MIKVKGHGMGLIVLWRNHGLHCYAKKEHLKKPAKDVSLGFFFFSSFFDFTKKTIKSNKPPEINK